METVIFEYKPQVKRRNGNGKWENAVLWKRTYSSREEAISAINEAIRVGQPRFIKAYKNGNYIDEWYTDLEVIETRVLVRAVSAWELDELAKEEMK